MIFEFSDYRNFLKAVLVDRISQNGRYSLRAMARDLRVAPSVLTNLFQGKRNLSHSRSFEVARHLGLAEKESDYFSLLVQLDAAKHEEDKERVMSKMRDLNPSGKIRDLNVDSFKLISDWYHIPILAMTEIDDLQLSIAEISSRLGISKLVASTAVDRLQRLGLLTDRPDGGLKRTFASGVFKSTKTNIALRHFHRQMLEKAIASVETQSNQEKWIGSETLAFDPSDLTKAAEITETYLAKMKQLAESGQNKSQIYHLFVQFFRLTKGEKQ